MSMRTILLLAALPVIIALFAVAVGVELYFNYATAERSIAGEQALIAENAAGIVRGFIKDKQNLLSGTADLSGLISLSSGEQQLILDKIIGGTPSFRQVFLLGINQQELKKSSRLTNESVDPLTDVMKQKLFEAVLNKTSFVSEVYIDPSANEPLVIIAVPAYDILRNTKGAFVAEVNLKFMWDMIGKIKVGETGVAYVVDKHGDLIGFGDIGRVLKRENLKGVKEVDDLLQHLGNQVNTEAKISHGIYGTQVVSAHVSLGSPDWAVVVETPAAEAYRSVLDVLRLSLLLIAICLLIAGAWALYITKVIVSPLVRLRDIVSRLNEEHLDEQVSISASSEINELAGAFDAMRNKLQSYIREHKEEHAQLTASISSLPIGLMVLDEWFDAVFINPTLIELCKLNTAEISLKGVKEKLAGYDLDHQISISKKERRVVVEKEVSVGKQYFSISTAPVLTVEHSEFIGVVVMIVDITEEKIIERSKDEFFSIASHELRTPLTAIRGNASMLKEMFSEKITDIDAREMIGDMWSASERLIRIVGDFLSASRLEQHKIHFKSERIDLASLVADVVAVEKPRAAEKNIALTFVTPDGLLPLVSADIEHTKEVIKNLLSNAINYTDGGGVSVRIEPKQHFLKVLVKDSGVGIPLKNQSLLFHKLQQAGDMILARDVTEGTGLGLYLSKLIVEGMGGEIALEASEMGVGSTFSFTLPLADDKENEA